MPRRPVQRPTITVQDHPWIFFNIGLDHPEDVEIVTTFANATAKSLHSLWPTGGEIPKGLTDDFGPEIFTHAARIAFRPDNIRSFVFSMGDLAEITDLSNLGFLSRDSKKAIQTMEHISNVTRDIPNWPIATNAFRSAEFYIAAGGTIGKAEIIRELITVGTILAHTHFKGQTIERGHANLFMHDFRAQHFQKELFHQFPAYAAKKGIVKNVPEEKFADVLTRSNLSMKILLANRVLVERSDNDTNGHEDNTGNGSGNGHKGAHRPKPQLVLGYNVNLDRLEFLKTATIPTPPKGITL